MSTFCDQFLNARRRRAEICDFIELDAALRLLGSAEFMLEELNKCVQQRFWWLYALQLWKEAKMCAGHVWFLLIYLFTISLRLQELERATHHEKCVYTMFDKHWNPVWRDDSRFSFHGIGYVCFIGFYEIHGQGGAVDGL